MRYEALQYRYLSPVLDSIALTLSTAIEARNLETGEHCRQLGVLSERMAAVLGLDERRQMTIRIGGYLHDIGKIGIADAILLKPGRLTESEMAEMRRHSEIGAAILEVHEAMADIAQIVRHHHERWDGRGYPDALVGDDIPLGGRIIAVADAFSAMTSDRIYRPAMPHRAGLGGAARPCRHAVRSGDRRRLRAGRGRGRPASPAGPRPGATLNGGSTSRCRPPMSCTPGWRCCRLSSRAVRTDGRGRMPGRAGWRGMRRLDVRRGLRDRRRDRRRPGFAFGVAPGRLTAVPLTALPAALSGGGSSSRESRCRAPSSTISSGPISRSVGMLAFEAATSLPPHRASNAPMPRAQPRRRPADERNRAMATTPRPRNSVPQPAPWM